MKPRTLRAATSAAMLMLALTFCSGTHAGSTDAVSGAEDIAPIDLGSLSDTEALQFACLVLAPGNHNYNGHRAAAMREIKAAAQVLGVDFEAKSGKGHEDQKRSDTRLRLAQKLLEQVRARLTTAEPALEHVDKAWQHLQTALKIRAVEAET